MRIIDADRLKDNIIYTCDLGGWIGDTILQIKKLAIKYIDITPTIETKQVKYFDEDEKVWKIGEVIVSDSEKPNNSKVSDISTGSERSSE